MVQDLLLQLKISDTQYQSDNVNPKIPLIEFDIIKYYWLKSAHAKISLARRRRPNTIDVTGM